MKNTYILMIHDNSHNYIPSISPKSKRSYAYHMKEKYVKVPLYYFGELMNMILHSRSRKSDFVPKRSSECSGSSKPTGTIEVVVTHIESCWMFWAQVVNHMFTQYYTLIHWSYIQPLSAHR